MEHGTYRGYRRVNILKPFAVFFFVLVHRNVHSTVAAEYDQQRVFGEYFRGVRSVLFVNAFVKHDGFFFCFFSCLSVCNHLQLTRALCG